MGGCGWGWGGDFEGVSGLMGITWEFWGEGGEFDNVMAVYLSCQHAADIDLCITAFSLHNDDRAAEFYLHPMNDLAFLCMPTK